MQPFATEVASPSKKFCEICKKSYCISHKWRLLLNRIFMEDPMKNFLSLALALLPLTLVVACEKKAEEAAPVVNENEEAKDAEAEAVPTEGAEAAPAEGTEAKTEEAK
jgi:hypothetical protein